jgi:uncharacterized protein YdeI (YjbR/CyaY-like superfamily)
MEERITFKDRNAFRKWLSLHHGSKAPLWLEFYKDGTPCVNYEEALEEALSYGWIDSLIKRVDDRIYVRKFSKRKNGSKWSEKNKKIVASLIKKGMMTEWGLEAVKVAEENGRWNKKNTDDSPDVEGLKDIICKNRSLANQFEALPESLKKTYARYYYDAKREETRKRRLERIMEFMKIKKPVM